MGHGSNGCRAFIIVLLRPVFVFAARLLFRDRAAMHRAYHISKATLVRIVVQYNYWHHVDMCHTFLILPPRAFCRDFVVP